MFLNRLGFVQQAKTGQKPKALGLGLQKSNSSSDLTQAIPVQELDILPTFGKVTSSAIGERTV